MGLVATTNFTVCIQTRAFSLKIQSLDKAYNSLPGSQDHVEFDAISALLDIYYF